MPDPLTLGDLVDLEVGVLHGVGPKRAKALAQVGIATVADLLTTYPRRYVDRTREAVLSELGVGEEATVVVRVTGGTTRRTRRGQALTNIDCADSSGARLRLTFFNQSWRERQLKPGATVVVFGRLEAWQGMRQMTSPVVDLVGDRTGRIVPIYPQSEKAGLTSWEIAELVEEALRRSTPRGLADPVPTGVRRRLGLIDRERAVRAIHAPATMADMNAARRRLVFDELLRVQLALVQRKRQLEARAIGIAHAVDGGAGGSADGVGGSGEGGEGVVERFLRSLPFPLTAAQVRVISEIRADLARATPMHRLLQGDVGAGKTVVAVATLLTAVQGGYQGALMAPTEVLAEQHHLGIAALLADFTVPDPATLLGERPLRVELLTNRTQAAERRRVLAGLADGSVELVIGTHALIQEGITFARLGAVVIDEQHRFGVEQRAALRSKNAEAATPDVLVMTATPIPRTAAMTVYGDLDVSVLDELPVGRRPIETRWARTDGEEGEAWEAVRAEVEAGRQAYVVTPLVEGSDRMEVASAEETFERLGAGELSGLRLGLLHGRVAPGERATVMEAFRSGGIDVLVATTVIEVGVDVPNATVMVVLDADRFGIAQLHQLRGRVGRGSHHSMCFLLSRAEGPPAAQRLEALVRSTDGFELAEVDLELRGEGTLMGERQKGRNDLKLASLRRDRDVVATAREVAGELVDAEGRLDAYPALAAEVELLLGGEEAEFLLKS